MPFGFCIPRQMAPMRKTGAMKGEAVRYFLHAKPSGKEVYGKTAIAATDERSARRAGQTDGQLVSADLSANMRFKRQHAL
jgi:hypothetical protein